VRNGEFSTQPESLFVTSKSCHTSDDVRPERPESLHRGRIHERRSAAHDGGRRSAFDAVYQPCMIEFYSNYGYALLGTIIEKASGERYEQYVQNHILDTLGPTPIRTEVRLLDLCGTRPQAMLSIDVLQAALLPKTQRRGIQL